LGALMAWTVSCLKPNTPDVFGTSVKTRISPKNCTKTKAQGTQSEGSRASNP